MKRDLVTGLLFCLAFAWGVHVGQVSPSFNPSTAFLVTFGAWAVYYGIKAAKLAHRRRRATRLRLERTP